MSMQGGPHDVPSSTLRAFVAIELPEAVRAHLGAAARKIAARVPELRPVPISNLHLTLRFLGDVAEATASTTAGALVSALAGVRAFEMTVAGLGAFPDARRPRVLYAAIAGGSVEVDAVEARVRAGTEGVTTADDKPFRPHVTIARARGHRAPGLEDALVSSTLEPVHVPVREVVLMESRLGSGPPLYTALARVTLVPAERVRPHEALVLPAPGGRHEAGRSEPDADHRPGGLGRVP